MNYKQIVDELEFLEILKKEEIKITREEAKKIFNLIETIKALGLIKFEEENIKADIGIKITDGSTRVANINDVIKAMRQAGYRIEKE